MELLRGISALWKYGTRWEVILGCKVVSVADYFVILDYVLKFSRFIGGIFFAIG